MSSTDDACTELDEAQIVRPERFVLPEVSGIAVPRRVTSKGKTFTEWQLMLRWSDGRREAIRLDEAIQVAGKMVYLRPQCPAPEPNQIGRWSTDARQKWLAGEATLPADELCRQLIERYAKYLHLPSESGSGLLVLLACWTVLTYVYPVFDAIPYLAIGGPTGSGKTRVLDLLEQLAFRPLVTSNLTNSALFRHLDSYGGTALLDEAERFQNVHSPEVGELMSSLLAGYRRGKYVTKTETLGDGSHSPRHYCVSGPKAIACINALPPTLAARSISIPMLRCPQGCDKPRLRVEKDRETWSRLRDSLHAIAMEYGDEWLSLPEREHVCPEMSGRNFELWQPVLAIAEWFEGHGAKKLLPVLRDFAIRSIESSREAATPGEDELLLQELAALVTGGSRPTAKEVLLAVMQKEPHLFHRWHAKRAAVTLARYGFRTRPSQGRNVYDPSDDDLRRVQDAYAIDLGLPQPPAPEAEQLLLPGVLGGRGGRATQGV
jgi:hypothetical protein